MSYILPKAMFAIRDAITAQAFTWPASIRAGVSRGPLDEDPDANAASNPLPSIIVSANSAEQVHVELANAQVSIYVEVRHQADDTEPTTHLTQCAELADWMFGDDFLAAVNAYTGFTAFGRGPVNQSFDRNGRKWVSRFDFNLSAAPGDIS
jgi:hypothetical protein